MLRVWFCIECAVELMIDARLDSRGIEGGMSSIGGCDAGLARDLLTNLECARPVRAFLAEKRNANIRA